jgi:hypothetical protein
MLGLEFSQMVLLLLFKQCLGIINLGVVELATMVVVMMAGFSLKFVKIILLIKIILIKHILKPVN